MKFIKKPIIVEAFQMTIARRASNEDWPHWLHMAWQKERNDPRIRNQQVAGSSPVVGSKETPRGSRLRGVFVSVPRCWIMRNCGESLRVSPDQVIQN